MHATILSALFAAFATTSLAAPAPPSIPLTGLPAISRVTFTPSGAESEAVFVGVPRTVFADTVSGGSLWILPNLDPATIGTPLILFTTSPTTAVSVRDSCDPHYLTFSTTTGLLELRDDAKSEFMQTSGTLVPKPYDGAVRDAGWVACGEQVRGQRSGWTIYWSQFNVREGCVPVVIDIALLP